MIESAGYVRVPKERCLKALYNYQNWDKQQKKFHHEGMERVKNLPKKGWWIFKRVQWPEFCEWPANAFPELFDERYEKYHWGRSHINIAQKVRNLAESAEDGESVYLDPVLSRFVLNFENEEIEQ